MSRVDEMREVVNRLAGNHTARRSGLDALRRNVREQRADAAAAVSEMASQRTAMCADLHTELAGDLLGLRHEVQATLGEFVAERHSMAADLKGQLDATREQRAEQVTALRTEARQFVVDVAADRQAMAEDLTGMLSGAQIELSTGVRGLLGDFTTRRATMSQAQGESLAANGAERRSTVGEMIAHTQALLSQIVAEQQAGATRLHETLTADRVERRQLVAGMIVDIQALLQRIAADNDATATGLRASLSSDHQERSVATAGFMDAVKADRESMAEALANNLDAFTGALASQVSGSLRGFADERTDLHTSLAEMAQVWRGLAAALHGSASAAQPEPPKPQPLAIPASTASVLPAEDVDDRLLAYLGQHVEGVKLVELEPVFELSRPQLGRRLRDLVDSGRVSKDPDTLIYKLA